MGVDIFLSRGGLYFSSIPYCNSEPYQQKRDLLLAVHSERLPVARQVVLLASPVGQVPVDRIAYSRSRTLSSF